MKAHSRIAAFLLSLGLPLWLLSTYLRVAAVDPGKPASAGEKSGKAEQAPGDPKGKGAAGKHALLVGCTDYPNLRRLSSLDGPANDVILMRRVLVDRFGFVDGNIVTLSEEAARARGKTYKPTRKNIEREFKRLAEVAKAGDQVVILLSGHGSQQPEPNPPPDLRFAEPDGLDEVFLPADAGKWDGKGNITNAIIDDEFRVWTGDIMKKGASLWFIADCCHSGTLLRGTEVERRLTPKELGIPKKDIDAAVKRAAERQDKVRGDRKDSPFHLEMVPGKLVAIYAAQSHEVTVELKLPRGARDGKDHGLLTYTLCQVLQETPTIGKHSITYTELVQRIQEQYGRMGRSFPTPLVEGNGRDFQVLGVKEWPGRSRFFVTTDAKGELKLNAGALHGLTVKSILAVYPRAGDPGADKVAGHVRIRAIRPLEATLEPCKFAGMPKPKQLPERGRCEPVLIDYGDLRLDVAAASTDDRGQPFAEKQRKRLERVLRKLPIKDNPLLRVAAEERKANWLLRPREDGIYLLPAQGVKINEKGQLEGPRFGPFADDEDGVSALQAQLLTIARAENLKRLAGDPTADVARGGSRVAIKVEIVKFRDEEDQKGEVVPWVNGTQLRAGDIIAFRVQNVSKQKKVYLTLLSINKDYKIKAIYPRTADVQEALLPGQPFETDKLRVTGKGQKAVEQLLVIAVLAKGRPVDFSALASPTFKEAQRSDRSAYALDTPLGELLQNAIFAEGLRRDLEPVVTNDYDVRLRSWWVIP